MSGPLSLAPLADTHAEALTNQLADPRVWSMLSRTGASVASAAGALEQERVGRWQGVRQPFAILAGRRVVGLCGLSRQSRPVWERDVYYWVGAEHWGQGIATLAVGLLLARGDIDASVSRLTSLVRVINPGSRRVLERNGFGVERTFTASALTLPGFEGERCWELGRERSR